MRDIFDKPNAIDSLIRWSESRSGRLLGRRLQLGLGFGALAAGGGFIIEGLWNHDVEHIIAGVVGVTTGGFLAKFAEVQIEQIHAELPHN